MRDWTPTARSELERALDEHHGRLVGTGVDADEVVADIRRHVQTELGSGSASGPIDVEEVRRVLRHLGTDTTATVDPAEEVDRRGDRVGQAPTQQDRTGDGGRETGLRLRRRAAYWVFLVILPALTLGFELITELCATELFDPIGTVPQLLAVIAVPLLFGAVLKWQAHPAWRNRLGWLRAAAALAAGVCAYYAVQFGPLLPFSFVAIVFFGLGLLPLAPLLAFAASIDLLVQLRRLERAGAGARRVRPVWPLVLLGVGALVLTELSPICASLGMRWYESSDPEVRARGLSLLRSAWVDADDIDHPWRVSGLASGTSAILGWVTGSNGRIFGPEFDRMKFAATGASRDLADPDLWRRTRGRGRAGDARWSAFGDLALDGSRLDGTVDPDLLHGYVEWTMTLRNAESWPLEGRATLQLPSGGVVSRVTLWVDGEEREAAFAGRSAATRAYESVAIVQRRDPILVTTAGPDRVRLRCFPVPAGGQMKFRLGITFPLPPAPDATSAEVTLPSLLEANFAVPGSLQHHVWVGRAGGDGARVDDVDTKALRGSMSADALGRTVVRLRRDPARASAVGRAFDDGLVVHQEIRERPAARRRAALVIDGNPHVLRDHGPLLREALTLAGEGGAEIDLWLALDMPVHRRLSSAAEAQAFLKGVVDSGDMTDESGRRFSIPARAGFDNGPTVTAALSALRDAPGGGVAIWVHGPQVAATGGGEAVRQVLERSRGRVTLREAALVPGRNDLLNALEGRPEVHHLGDATAAGIGRALREAGGAATVEVVRTVLAIDPAADTPAPVATRHLARLWAAGEVERLAAAGPGRVGEAVALAVKHQLVTPVSGAVVLETQEQYDAHGLKPVDPASVPSVPETGGLVVVLMAALFVVVLARGWRRRGGLAA